MSYTSYDHDKLEAAKNLRIERTIYFEERKSDIAELTALPLSELLKLREESAAAEQTIFESLKTQAAAWEAQAGNTLALDKALEYVKTLAVSHTGNKWQQDGSDRQQISNAVYKMTYHVYENTRYDAQKQQSVPYSYTLTWDVYTNSPGRNNMRKIAGQDRKVFADRAAMEKYLNGRIKAYQHLFTELSPPIPKEYAECFKINGVLLPGYTVEGDAPQQAAAQAPEAPKPAEQAEPTTQTPAKADKTEPTQAEAQPQPEQTATQNDADAPPEPRPVIPILFASDDPADKMKEITERLEQGIQGVFESERYKDYLNTMSKLHTYSFRNTMLISMQGGQFVQGYTQWQTHFDRQVKAKEKGIKILAPAPYTVKRNVQKTDPKTKNPVFDADGKPVMEEKEITVPSYKVVSVFDVSQTEGKDLPPLTLAQPLIADVEQYEDFFKAIEKASPFPISFEPLDGEKKGGCLYDEQRIVINEGMSQLQNIKTAIHEAAHAKLHDTGSDFFSEDTQNRPDKRTREVQAEGIAYAVCQNFGLDTSDYSFSYLADWSSGKELTELKSSLETIHKTAKELITEIEGHFSDLQKAREAQREAQPDLTAEPTVTVIWSESGGLQDGQTISLSEADKLFASLDEARKGSPGYDKTKFSIDYVMNGEADHYEGQQDFGDGDGGLVEHIEKYHTHYANNPEWDNYLLRNKGKEALEADKAQREILLTEFVPYLKLHCNLSAMEQTTQRLMTAENLSPAETTFYNAMQKYVADCRGMLNQGEYALPPVPAYEDFDPDLQSYKQHVMDEIAQEAASAGMTVEEYAANGYEPYAPTQDAPVFEKLTPEQQQELSDTVKDTLQTLVDLDMKTHGEVTAATQEAIAAQGYAYRDGSLEKLTAAQPEPDTFSIYQLKRGDETRDFRFEPYDRLQAAGKSVDPANYELVYTAPLTPDTSLDSIYTRFNIDRPKDFTGHSLSISDVVVLHQNGQDAAYYIDSGAGYTQVPEFLQPAQAVELTPDSRLTGETVRTPRGSFRLTDMTREQIEAAGYGFHHQSDDGKYFIMGNGTRAFAIPAEQPQNHLKHVEDTVEQNDNSFDGIINNTPTVDELEAKVKAGEQISLVDLANAVKADKERSGGREKKPSIRAQLKAEKEKAAQRKPAKQKNHEMEV